MTTAPAPPRLDVRGLLFDDGHDTAAAVTRTLGEQGVAGVLGRLSAAALDAVHGEVATAAADLADLDVVDVVVAGWKKHRALETAARRSVASPATTEIVDLATHRIGCVHRPYVELLVDGARVATVDFEIALELTVAGLAATVRDGRLVAVGGGRCDVVCTMECEGVEVARRETSIDIPLTVRLGDGVDLLDGPEEVSGG